MSPYLKSLLEDKTLIPKNHKREDVSSYDTGILGSLISENSRKIDSYLKELDEVLKNVKG